MPDELKYDDLVAVNRAVEAYATETFPNRPDGWFKDILWETPTGKREEARMWKRVKVMTGLTGMAAKTAALLRFDDLAEEAIDS